MSTKMLLLLLSHIVQAAEGKRPDRNAEIKSGVKICLRHMGNKLKPLLALKYKAINDAKKELEISLIRSTFIGCY